jgi:AraC family transcriptional regulator
MFDIREAFVDDLYRWVMVKEIQLNPNGVGMMNIYEKDYASTGNVQIYVPIKQP